MSTILSRVNTDGSYKLISRWPAMKQSSLNCFCICLQNIQKYVLNVLISIKLDLLLINLSFRNERQASISVKNMGFNTKIEFKFRSFDIEEFIYSHYY